MNTTAPSPQPDPAESPALETLTRTELIDYAMRMVRIAVEQYEAAARNPPEAAATKSRRQPDPGSLFIRFANIVQKCIFGQGRATSSLPPLHTPRHKAQDAEAAPARVREPASPVALAEQPSAEPVRRALQTVTRNHPHGKRLLSAGLDCLAATLSADPLGSTDLQNLFRRVCDQAGIRLEPSLWRKAARLLACEIRAAPA